VIESVEELSAEFAIAPPGTCLNKSGRIRGIIQGFAQTIYRVIQPVVEVNERIARPESLMKFFSCGHLPVASRSICRT